MVWSKTDDKFHSHHKTKRALKGHPTKRRDAAAIGVWSQAQSWCGDNRSDGFVPAEELERYDDEWDAIAERLIDSGLWHPATRLLDGTVLVLADCESEKCGVGLERAELGDPRVDRLADEGFLFHDWKQWNPLKAKLEADERANRIRAELHRDTSLVNAIKRRDRNRCRYCGTEVNWRARRGATAATYDHVKPIVLGGGNTLDNVVVACQRCNDRKGGRTLREAGMKLLEPGALGAPVPDLGDDDDLPATQTRTKYASKSSGVSGSPRVGSGRVGSGTKSVLSTDETEALEGASA